MKKFLFSAVCAGALLLCGCTNTARFNYSAATGPMPVFSTLPNNPTVGVLPAVDKRGEKYILSGDSSMPSPTGGSFWLGMIPLMPFGWHTLLYPEQATNFATMHQFDFKPADDLATAAAESLKQSGLFSQVKIQRDAKNAPYDYLWKTEMLDTQYRGMLLTYGITYLAAPVLWVIGFPDGISTVDLSLRFTLIEVASGKAVWQYEFNGSDYLWHWIYTRIGEDCSLYASLMKFGMASAMTDLDAKLGGK